MSSPVSKKEEPQNGSRDQPCENCFHRLSQPHGQESQSHDHNNVNDCKNGKCITEWTMNNMPEMKHSLRLVKKDDALGERCLLADQPDDVFNL